MKASIVTGAGVEALMGAFDSQIKSAQAIFTTALRDVISLCFEADEKIFNVEKTVRGVDAGSPYAITYLPSKDIKGDYSADVRYGMLAGLNPAQGLIFMLQALGGKLISKDMAMRELPFNVNVTMEQEKIETEDLRAALLGALSATAQAIPQMVVQGGDPSNIVRNIATVIQQRQKGRTLEDIVEEVFAPQNPPAGAAQAVESPVSQTPGGPVGGSPEGAGPGPVGQGEPVGPPFKGPGETTQRPELQSILASLSSSGKVGGGARTISRRTVQ
jgi:hypothetical protein